MPRVKASQLARARGNNEMSQTRMTRNKMRADWDTVRAVLTDPKTPRRDAEYARSAETLDNSTVSQC
jgi:hypothetical protein